MQEYIQKLEELRLKIPEFVDCLAFSYLDHWRIITDKPIIFPRNYQVISHDRLIDISHVPYNETNGWGNPDKIFGGVEVRYLWKKFKNKLI